MMAPPLAVALFFSLIAVSGVVKTVLFIDNGFKRL